MSFNIGDTVRIFDTPEITGIVIEVLADDCRVQFQTTGHERLQLVDKELLEIVIT